MKKFFFTTIAAACMVSSAVIAQVAMPAPSTTQMIRQDFGMGKIEITYSRPIIKGRKYLADKSELAPYGELWRTGANAATKVRFTDKVTIGGQMIDSGTYVLYTIPNKNEWEVILNKGLSNWGSSGYKQTDDVARFKVPSAKTKNFAEAFTMQVTDVKPETCGLQLAWGNTLVNIPVSTNIKDRLRSQIETALKGEKKPYYQAASFYYEWDKDYTKAMENIDKALTVDGKAYWMHLLKAKIALDMGNKTVAKTSAQKVVELATEAKNDDYVRMANLVLKKV